MCHGLFSINIMLHYSILIYADCGQDIKSVLIAGTNTIENKTDNDLLPRRSSFVPELCLLQIDNISNILHNSMKSSSSKNFIFVVIGNGNEYLCMSIEHGSPQIISIA